MANLTIRNLDDAVVEKLKARAKAHHRSLEAELRALLSEAASRPSREEFRKRAERIAAMTPDAEQTDSTKIIREFRDR
ncbi:MAG: Arc family DNA-binding protein [Kiloniellaceae bacterium]